MILLIVALLSIALAVVMSVVAWRSARREQRRSEARIATLAAAIHDEPAPHPAVAPGVGDLFAAPPAARGVSRFAAAAAGGVFVCSCVAALAIVSGNASGSTRAAADRSNRLAPADLEKGAGATSIASPTPLELVALGHESEGDRLTVRGIVRNPSSGAALGRVTAVVLLFKGDGGFLSSGQAIVESPALGPGGETAFAVTVPGASGVGRYRVSFRTEDRVVPHIDRRGRTSNFGTLEP